MTILTGKGSIEIWNEVDSTEYPEAAKPKKAKCSKCGRAIKNIYTWNDEIMGIECWKKYALPELLAQRETEDREELEYWAKRCMCLIETLKAKSLKRITNQFKLNFIPSVIDQFETKARLSRKQYDICLDFFSNTDWDNFYILEYRHDLIGLEDCEHMTGFTKEEIEAYNKI